MFCPKCKTEVLMATKIDQGLSAMGCNQCEGAFVSLLYYRDWLERTTLNEVIVAPCEIEEIQDTTTAMACPKCRKLMTKFKISGDASNRIDLCATCDEAWLDGGEWELLKALELNRKMPLVFTEQWQRKLRKQASDEIREKRLQQFVSIDEFAKVKKIRERLLNHPYKQEILFFIGHD